MQRHHSPKSKIRRVLLAIIGCLLALLVGGMLVTGVYLIVQPTSETTIVFETAEVLQVSATTVTPEAQEEATRQPSLVDALTGNLP